MGQFAGQLERRVARVAEGPENISYKTVKEMEEDLVFDLVPATCTEHGESKKKTFCRQGRI